MVWTENFAVNAVFKIGRRYSFTSNRGLVRGERVGEEGFYWHFLLRDEILYRGGADVFADISGVFKRKYLQILEIFFAGAFGAREITVD